MIVTLLNLRKRLGNPLNSKQKKFVNKLTPEDFEKAFNHLGYEVESVKKFSNLKGLKFAKITEVVKNNNADYLNVCRVQIAKNSFLTIQTVAKNPAVGYMSIIFPAGAQKDGQVFQEKEIKGVVSQGMFCGLNELGYEDEYLNLNKDDILIFNLNGNQYEEQFYNSDPAEFFELNDYIFDISIPANRNDANSYYVLTKELAAFFNVDFYWRYEDDSIRKVYNTKIKIAKSPYVKHLSYMEVKTSDHLPIQLYLADNLLLAKHKIKITHDFGIDLSNLCLLMTGTPIMSYNREQISNSLKPLLYSGKLKLDNDTEVNVKDALVIQDDNNEILSLAQVSNCNKTLPTTAKIKPYNVVFEIGMFEPDLIRKNAKQVNMLNSFSMQGSRPLNKEMLRLAFLYLMNKFNEYKLKISNIINPIIVKKNKAIAQNKKKLKVYANSKFKKLPIKEISNLDKNKLGKIGFKINKNRFLAPPYRNDILLYEDIIEEYFRFYGYDKFIPFPPDIKPYKTSVRDNRKIMLRSQGYSEIKTYTLTSLENNKLNPFNYQEDIKLMTFVSKEREVVRNSIITSMMETAIYNTKQKINNFSLFEEGMINQNQFVYGLLSTEKSFFEMKKDIINLFNDDQLEFIPFIDNEYIHKNVSAKIMKNNQMIGWIGKVHPKLNWLDCFVAEIFKTPISSSNMQVKETIYEPLKSIDLTFAIPLNSYVQSKIEEIKSLIEPFEIKVIDSFIKNDLNYITIRVTSKNEDIELLNRTYNN
ncbi:MAG: phenylalanine--tRNA ligase subunit beta [Metamycoplasmataceae bacterium]